MNGSFGDGLFVSSFSFVLDIMSDVSPSPVLQASLLLTGDVSSAVLKPFRFYKLPLVNNCWL